MTWAAENFGLILALGGFVLLMLSGWGRSWRERPGQPRGAGLQKWRRWLDLAAVGLILAGLLVMGAQK